MMEKPTPALNLNDQTFRAISFILIAMMMTCAAFTLLSLLERLIPGWRPFYLAGLVLFTALERLFTYHRFIKLRVFSSDWALAGISEWVVMVLAVKVTVSLSYGLMAFQVEFQHWLTDFEQYFLSFEFLFALIVVIFTWGMCGGFAALVDEMGLEHAVIAQTAVELQTGEVPARDRLLSRILSLGTVLIIFTALVRIDLRALQAKSAELVFIPVPAFSGGGASTLLYFMFGLLLLSLAQFMDLNSRWSLLSIPVSPEITRRWALYGLIFFGLLAGVVGFLPTSYSLGFLTILGYGISFILGIFTIIGEALFSLLLFLLSLPFKLFNQTPLFKTRPIIPPTPLTPGQLGSVSGPPAWLDLARNLAFSLMIAAVLAFSIVQFLRQHAEILQAVRKFASTIRLSRFWAWWESLIGRFKANVEKINRFTRERIAGLSSTTAGPMTAGLTGLRRLSPRQKVAFFYLALLRRGSENGLGRRDSQTPNEYAAELNNTLPDVRREIDSLTQVFEEARYSLHEVAPAQVNLAREYWARIKQALRKKLTRN